MHRSHGRPRDDRERGRGEREKEKPRSKGTEREQRDDEGEREIRRPSKDPTRDQYKRHLDKLMENPEKPVIIPESKREKKPKEAPEFVRFYMGSSAGAGSEVFHVYRHLRRRENDRQSYIGRKAEEEEREMEFQQKLAANKMEADARTAKKRAKRLKRKQKQKLKKKQVRSPGVNRGGEGGSQEKESDGSGDEVGSESEEEPHFVIGGK